ncbi:MAG: hypothetical protein NWE95_06425 [Candidatus Bathyarchaeota archaeon]|jgi:SAM-dependent methyltransferase|nr:hypothetical protein [Candidatus Bathyarchaeota archaeon]
MHIPASRTLKKMVTDYVNRKALQRELKAKAWTFSDFRISLILGERDLWDIRYQPVPLKDKTVLDIGAGEGETAKFFLEHGAKKVICIEPDEQAFNLLSQNAKNHPQIVPIRKKFELNDLKTHDFQFLKVDIEGYEEALLDTVLEQPAVIEVHGLQLRDKFLQQGYRIENFSNNPEFICISFAYWKC